MADLNVTMDDKFFTYILLQDERFLNEWSLIDKPTCYKNFGKATCIIVMNTNKPNHFEHSNVFETGLSDFHLLVVTEFKMGFQKSKFPRTTCRNYRNFNNDKFQTDVKNYRFPENINSFNSFCFQYNIYCSD